MLQYWPMQVECPVFKGKACNPSLCRAGQDGERAWEYSARTGGTGDTPEIAATDGRRDSAQRGNCEIQRASRKLPRITH